MITYYYKDTLKDNDPDPLGRLCPMGWPMGSLTCTVYF